MIFPAEYPQWIVHAGSVGFGLIFGSFTNVVVARLPHRKSLVSPRSACPHCSAPILARDNIPILGYLMLRGRCRRCRAPISIRYPVIEFLGGALFLAAEMRYGAELHVFLRDWPFLILLLATTFIDLEHRIIPDELSLGGLAFGLATCFLSRYPWMSSFTGAALGFALFYSLAWAYEVFAKRQGLGGGDIKLLAMLGAFLGPMGVLFTIVISSIFGSVIGVGWAVAAKKRNLMSFAIPYGPFLVVGALMYYFFGDELMLRFMVPLEPQ